jgi:hypothetical protein
MDLNNDDIHRDHGRGVVSDADTASRHEQGEEQNLDRDEQQPTEEHAHAVVGEEDENNPSEHSLNYSDPPDISIPQHVQAQVQEQQQQQQQQGVFSYPPPPLFNPGPELHQNPVWLQYYEARMRDHAAAYASAAAGAAWAATQIAQAAAANVAASSLQMQHQPFPIMLPTSLPPMFPLPPMLQQPQSSPPMGYGMNHQQQQQHQQPFHEQPCMGSVYYYPPNNNNNNNNNNNAPPFHLQDDLHNINNNNAPSMDDSTSEGMQYNRHRRKRQQRMPPSSSETRPPPHQQQQQQQHPPPSGFVHDTNNNNANSNERRGRRRRFRNDESSGGEPDHPATPNSYNQSSSSRRCRKSFRKQASSSSDGGGEYKKKQQPSDESLLGKTGVSALYEWCGKRRTAPNFTLIVQEESSQDTKLPPGASQDDFEMAVFVDGMQWGRGRGRTKSAAKQEGSRRALQALLPGVVFDEANGVLIELPSSPSTPSSQQGDLAAATRKTSNTATSLEDLAPNLAKRLAIGHNEEEEDDDDKDLGQDGAAVPDSKKRHKPSSQFLQQQQPHQVFVKWQHVYPGTSTTTSEEEDENAYYASRGASVCSALLHAMVQIDERIPEAPSYAYEVSTIPSSTSSSTTSKGTTSNNAQLKRKGGPAASAAGGSTVVIHRGTFTCTAKMKIKLGKDDDINAVKSLLFAGGKLNSDDDDHDHNQSMEYHRFDTLEAVGVGGTKRDARHIASAKLLALLFPECNGMAQVKQAAEVAREIYAASKALKQQSKRERGSTTRRRYYDEDENDQVSPRTKSLSFATEDPSSGSPALPSEVAQHFRAALLRKIGRNDHDQDEVVEQEQSDRLANAREQVVKSQENGIARQLSRQKQLDDRIAFALQQLNERDEEGRCLPDELTVDDVGRTVLRKATAEDIEWIEKLLGSKHELKQASSSSRSSLVSSCMSPVSVLGKDRHNISSNDTGSLALRLWSSSTIVLLLCRAIAPFEDPPLGCAVLTLGFSMEKGRLLRIAQIASEPHLPRERFIECLQSFANCISCSLAHPTSAAAPSSSATTLKATRKSGMTKLSPEDLGVIVDSYLAPPPALSSSDAPDVSKKAMRGKSEKNVHVQPSSSRLEPSSSPIVGNISSPLQSVLEEESSEGGEESEVLDASCPEKRKRSRVE